MADRASQEWLKKDHTDMQPAEDADHLGILIGTDGMVYTVDDSGIVTALVASVQSFNGRTGVIVPQQGDYDGFFLTPGEGNGLYQPLNAANLSAIAALTTTAFGRSLLELDDSLAARAALSVYSQTQVNNGFQPLSTNLTTIAGLTPTNPNFLQSSGGVWSSRTPAQAMATLPDADFSTAGRLTAAEKLRLNALSGRTSAGASPRIFRPAEFAVGNTYDPTGAVDSTTSFAAMMTAYNAFADRAVIMLAPGVFKIDTGVLQGFPSAPGAIHGPGRGVCVLVPNQATGDMIKLASGVDGFAVEGFAVYQTGSPSTAGSGVNTNGADSVTIENMLFVNQFVDINVNGASIKVSVQRTVHSQTNGAAGSVGVLINNGAAGDTYIGPDVVMSNTGAVRRRASVEVTESGHYEIIQSNLTGSAQGILVDPAAGKIVAFGFHTNVLCDSCVVNGMTLSASTSTSTIKNIKSVNSWYAGTTPLATYTPAAGVLTSGVAGGIINGITFLSDRFLNNQTHGFQHGFGTDFRFSDCDMKGNSAGSSGSSDGLNVAAAVSNWSVNGGKYGGSDTVPTATTQRYGIMVTAGAGDNIKIAPDDLTGNITGPISMGATGLSTAVSWCPGLCPGAARSSAVSIALAETLVVNCTIPKNSVRVGSAWRISAGGVLNATAATTTTMNTRVRIGTTTLAGNVPAGCATVLGAIVRTNQVVSVDGLVTIYSIGAGGTAFGYLNMTIAAPTAVATGIPLITALTVAAVAVDTTADKLIELTFGSALATTNINWTSAQIIQTVY